MKIRLPGLLVLLLFFSAVGACAPELVKLDIPADANVIATYPIAPLGQSANSDLAKAFVDYVLSAEGQATLGRWGFTPVAP